MSLPFDVSRCAGAKRDGEQPVVCTRRGSCQRYGDYLKFIRGEVSGPHIPCAMYLCGPEFGMYIPESDE